jgi:hypothetical protein
MQQMTLAHRAEFQRYSKRTRRERFLDEMDTAMPWAELLAPVEPHYSKGEVGRQKLALSAVEAGGSFHHAARVFFAAVACALGPGGRGRALRICGTAALCWR